MVQTTRSLSPGLTSVRPPFARRRDAAAAAVAVLKRSGVRDRLRELDELLPRRLELQLSAPSSSSSSSLNEEGVGGVGRW